MSEQKLAFEDAVAGWLLERLPENQAVEFFELFGGRKLPKRPKFLVRVDRQEVLTITLACVIAAGGRLTEQALDRAAHAAMVSRSTVQTIWERGRRDAALEAIRARTSPIRLKKTQG